jgi:homoserine kinase
VNRIMTPDTRSVTAFAPASVGNVGVGFDVLGHALDAVGDRVRLTERAGRDVRLEAVSGTVTSLPEVPEQNTALRALLAIQREFSLESGASVSIHKGIPLGSGMGGSAASAVAAVTAAAEFWSLDLGLSQRLHFALQGEEAASGALHADNVAPSLLGGLVLCGPGDPPTAVRMPVPEGIACVLVHPRIEIRTRQAREMLAATVALGDHVRQTMAISGFVAGCYRSDLGMIGRCLRDFVIEPQRSALVPGFRQVQEGAMGAGAMGCSLSGSGPSMFAWVTRTNAEAVRAAMLDAFTAAGVESDAWISPVDAQGARIEGGD